MTQEKNKLYPLNPDKTLVIKSKHIFLEDGQFHAGLLFIQNGKIEKICVKIYTFFGLYAIINLRFCRLA